MQSIEKIDANFQIRTTGDGRVMGYYEIPSPHFDLYGVFYENGKFRRLPETIAKGISPGVHALHSNTAGGRLRFSTDSSAIAIDVKMSGVGKMSHFALCGSAGFDLYVDGEFRTSFLPPFNITDGYQGFVDLGSAEMREITLHFPLYSQVDALSVGLSEGAFVGKASPYEVERPMVFYGSSITQGGCASRSGNAYPAILSRRLNADHINLGFTGNAKGEPAMADYINSLPMSVLIYDYDHNAPNLAHLENTHEAMFKAIRRAHPDLPIVILSRPKFTLTREEQARLAIIRRTYENALARGDEQVYFIDGPALMELAEGEGTVDGCHPTDFGFYSMAAALTPLLKKILYPCEG